MHVEFNGKEKFDADITAWLLQTKVVAAEAAVGMAKQAFEQILKGSPQYSGDFTSGWGVGYGKVVTNFVAGRFPEHAYGKNKPYSMASPEPMEAARNAAQWGTPALGTTIYISNDAAHEGDAYAWAIEEGRINLRPENQGASGMVRDALSYLKQNYSQMSSAQLATLRGVGV